MSEFGTFVVNHATRSVFGVGSHRQTGDILKEMGCRKVIVVYDPTIGALGIADKVIDSIHCAGIETVRFGEAEPEPSARSANRAGALARSEQVDGVVGIGGGSSLDTAKAVNLLTANPGPLEDYIGANRGIKPILKKFPLVLLPTTAGTSAEITPVFVVSDSETGKKTGARNRGDVAIVDPSFELGIPPHVTASTGIDMLAHVTESLINPAPHAMTELLDEQVISLVFRYLPRAYQDGQDLEARTQLAFACMVAGYAFADKGTYVGHAVADHIANRFHYPHGVACSLGILVAVRYAVAACPDKVHRIARAIGLPADQSEREVGQSVLDAYRKLIRSLGLKNMREMGVDQALIQTIVSELPNDVRFRNNRYHPDYELTAAVLREEWMAD